MTPLSESQLADIKTAFEGLSGYNKTQWFLCRCTEEMPKPDLDCNACFGTGYHLTSDRAMQVLMASENFELRVESGGHYFVHFLTHTVYRQPIYGTSPLHALLLALAEVAPE